jgi:hypothetical protein
VNRLQKCRTAACRATSGLLSMLLRKSFSEKKMSHSVSSKPNRISHAIAICAIATLAVFGLSPAVCAADGEVYSVSLPSPVIKSGASGPALVRIMSAAGWKWNKEYPAKVSFTSEGSVKVTPAELSKSAGNIEVDDQGNASLPLTLAGSSAGETKVNMKASFSVCSEESCKVFRNKEFHFTVKVE